MLDDGAGQARRLEEALRDVSSTRATCTVAAAASFSWPTMPTPGLGSRHRDAKACRTRVLLLAAFSQPAASQHSPTPSAETPNGSSNAICRRTASRAQP